METDRVGTDGNGDHEGSTCEEGLRARGSITGSHWVASNVGRGYSYTRRQHPRHPHFHTHTAVVLPTDLVLIE